MPEWLQWATGITAALGAVGALWINSSKDRRDAKSDEHAAKRDAFDLDRDLRAELDRIWNALMGQRQALFAVAQSIRTDADLAIQAGDAVAAAAHRADAARIETALITTAPTPTA